MVAAAKAEATPAPTPGAVREHTHWIRIGGVALVGGYLASWLGYVLTLRPAGVVFLWPPSGFVLAALLVMRRRDWPPVLAGACLGNMLTDFQHGATPYLAIAGAVVNTLEQFLAAWVAIRLAGGRGSHASLRALGAFLVGAVLIANAVTAIFGSLVLTAYTSMPFWRAWFNWWTGDGMGMLILTPAVVTTVVAIRQRRFPSRRDVLEGSALLASVVVVAVLLLSSPGAAVGTITGHAYLAYPFLIVAGIRIGPWGAAAATLALTTVTAIYAVSGSLVSGGATTTATNQVLELYTYLALASISALLPAAVIFDRDEKADELRASESRFRQLAENISEAFFVVDLPAAKPVYVSPSWATIWDRPLADGYDPQVWFSAIHPDDRVRMREAQQVNARGAPTETEFRIMRPDGSVRTLRGRAFPVRDAASGIVTRVVGLAEDVTGLRDVERRFVQAQKLEAVGRLAGGVAHDFNNLLTVIFAETELLASRDLPDTERESVAEIRHSAESAAALTRQLLTFSHRHITEPVVFDLNAVVSDTAQMLRRMIGEDVSLELRLEGLQLGVRADRGLMEQVLTNLAVNARDAMPRGGTIVIETAHTLSPDDVGHSAGAAVMSGSTPTARWVLLSVRDTGTGMADDVIARAFEPFYTTKALGRGTGLGLSTCFDIVTQAGGRIAIFSKVGVGTTIRVWLPAVEVVAAQEPVADTAPNSEGRERVLLVEDETGVRKATARLLRARGYEVLEARDGPDALRVLADERGRVDLLLTDVVLPGMSGPELSSQVHKALPAVKTLFVSGYTGDAISPEVLESSQSSIVAKPFTAGELARRVREALDKGVAGDEK